MAAQVFWAVFFQPMADPNWPNSWFRWCCHSTPYIFHDAMLWPLKAIVFLKFFLCSFDILPLYYIVDLWSNFEEKNKSTAGPNCSMSPKLPNTKRRTKVNFFVPNFRSDTISFPVLLSKISGMKLELIGCKIILCAASYVG